MQPVRKTQAVPVHGFQLKMSGTLKKLSPDQVAECVELYRSGLSCGKLADRFRVSRQAIHDLLKRRIRLRPQRMTGSDSHLFRGGVLSSEATWSATKRAIKSGVLRRPDVCETCGNAVPACADGRSRIQAHHCDYNKPLDVMWLCDKCHREWHKTNTPIQKTVSG
jgi:hypothetical protein